ncbi:MAG: helix-turn-helix domain-containing protein [Egibacteraceae bacterium]
MATGSEVDGGVLRDLRRIRLMEQLDLANAACVIDPGCALSREDVSAYERGTKQPSARKLHAILRALNSAVVLGRPAPLSDAEVRALIATPSLDAALPAEQEDDVDRRHLNAVLAALLGGAVAAPLGDLGEAIERIAAGAKYPADEGLIASHERIAVGLAQEYTTAKPGVLLPVVAAAADGMLEDLGLVMTGTQRGRLSAVAVGAHAQAGLLAVHAGRWPTAYRYLSMARSLAEASGDPTLRAQALTTFANLYDPLARGGAGGDPTETKRLLDQAADAATGHAPGLVLADIQKWRGALHARAGDAEAAKPDLAAAEQGLGKPAGPDHGLFSPAALYRGMEAGVERIRGLVYAADGRFDAAERTLRVSPQATPRGHVTRLVFLGEVRVQAREPEGACQALGDGHGQAVAAGYTMGVEQIRSLRDRFPPPWSPLACVVALDDRLRPPA